MALPGVRACLEAQGPLSAAAAECIAAARAAAPRDPVQMGPLDGTWLARLVAGMLAWECAFRCVRAVAARHTRPTAAAATREERDFSALLVPSYTVSTVHAVLMCWRGALHVLQLWHAPEAEKLLITPGGAFYAANRAVELSNWAFATYMCYDLAHVLAVYPRLGGMATVFHHSSFALAALVAGVSRAFSFAFGWLILCEASTPFLNLRWLFKTMQKREPAALSRAAAALGYRTQAGLEFAIDGVFAATFLSTRVAGYGAGFAMLLRSAARGFLAPVAPVPRALMLSLVTAGFALNLVWSRRLVRALFRSAAKAREAEAAAADAEAADAAAPPKR